MQQSKMIWLAIMLTYWKYFCFCIDIQSQFQFTYCNQHQYMDENQNICQSCTDQNCDQCLQNTCLSCQFGNIDFDNCLASNQKCQSGFYFNQDQQMCMKCKDYWCDICDSKGDCFQCKTGFDLGDNSICQPNSSNHQQDAAISCSVGYILNNGQCFENEICSASSLKQNKESQLSLSTVLKYLDGEQLIAISDDQAIVYDSKEVQFQRSLLTVADTNFEKLLSAIIYANKYLIILSNYYFYIYELKTLTFLAKNIANIDYNYLSFQKNKVEIHYNDVFNSIFVLFLMKTNDSIKVGEYTIVDETINISLQQKGQMLQFNQQSKVLVDSFAFLNEKQILITTSKSQVTVFNLKQSQQVSNLQYEIEFSLIDYISANDIISTVSLNIDDKQTIFYVIKQSINNIKFAQFIYDETKLDTAQAFLMNQPTNGWIKPVDFQNFKILSYYAQIQIIEQKFYMILQIDYLPTQYSSIANHFLGISDIEYFFSPGNILDYLHYEVAGLKLWKSKISYPYLVLSGNDVNSLSLFISQEEFINIYQITNINQDGNQQQIKDCNQRIAYKKIGIPLQYIDSDRLDELVLVIDNLLMKIYINQGNLVRYRANFYYPHDIQTEYFFTNKNVQEIVIPYDESNNGQSSVSFLIFNLMSEGRFQIVQTQEYSQEMQIEYIGTHQFRDYDQDYMSIESDSFYSDDEQIIYVIAKRGMYVIRYNTLTIITYTSFFAYIARANYFLLLLNYIQTIDPITQQPKGQYILQLFQIQQGNLTHFADVDTSTDNNYILQQGSSSITINQFDQTVIMVRYQKNISTATTFYTLFKDSKIIDINIPNTASPVDFLSENQVVFLYFDNNIFVTKVQFGLNANGEYKELIRDETILFQSIECYLLVSTRMSYCISFETYYIDIQLFLWDNMDFMYVDVAQSNIYTFQITDYDDIGRILEYTKVLSDERIFLDFRYLKRDGTKSMYASFYTLIFNQDQNIIIQEKSFTFMILQIKADFLQVPNSEILLYRQTTYNFNQKMINPMNLNAQSFLGFENIATSYSITYWPQLKSILYQDNLKVYMSKRITEFQLIGQSTQFSNEISFSNKYALFITQTNQVISFTSLDMKEVVYSKTVLQPINFTFWSDKYAMLILQFDDSVQGFNISNQFQNPNFIFQVDQNVFGKTPFDQNRDCKIGVINPLIICQSMGIYDFIANKFTLEQNVEVPDRFGFKSIVITENDQYLIIASSSQFLIYEVQTRVITIHKNVSVPQFFSIYLSSLAPGQGLIKSTVGCVIFSLPLFEQIKVITFTSLEYEQCFFEDTIPMLIHCNQQGSYVYKLPFNIQDQRLSLKPIKLIQGSSSQFFGYILFRTYAKITDDPVNIVEKIDLLTGSIIYQKEFILSSTSRNIEFIWEEKEAFLTNGIIVSYSSSLGIELSNEMGSIDNYSPYYNYGYLYQDSSYYSFDLSLLLPFNPQVADIQNAFRNTNANIFVQSKDLGNLLVFFNEQEQAIMKVSFDDDQLQKQNVLNINQINEYLQNVGYGINYQSSYKLLRVVDSTDTTNQLYALISRCKLILFAQDNPLDSLDIDSFSCKVFEVGPYLFAFNQQTKKLIEIQTNNHKLSIVEKSIQNNYQKVETLFSDEFGNWIVLKQAGKDNPQGPLFELIRNRQQNDFYQSQTYNLKSDITTIGFFQFQGVSYLFIGTSNSDNILYELPNFEANQIYPNLPLKTIFSLNQNCGKIKNFKILISEEMTSNQQQLNIIRVYSTGDTRISQVEARVASQSDISPESFVIKSQQLLHTRQDHSLNIMGSQYVSVLNSYQITIYSLSLRYICRMEESQYQNIQYINLAPDLKTFVVVDNISIYLYNIAIINSRDRLILQASFQRVKPIIYQIKQKSNELTTFIIYGSDSFDVFQIEYQNKPLIKPNTSSANCLQFIDEFNISLKEQRDYFYSILKERKSQTEEIIQLAINVNQDQQLILPSKLYKEQLFLDNGKSQTITQRISLEINLNGNTVELIQEEITDENINLIKILKVVGGKLVINQDLTLNNMSSITLARVDLKLSNSHIITIQNTNTFILDTVQLSNQSFEQTDIVYANRYIFELTSVQTIYIKDIKMMSLKLDKQSFMQFDHCTKVIIQNVQLNGLSFMKVQPLFYFKSNNLDISLDNISATQSIFSQLLKFIKTEKITITNLQITQHNIQKKRILDQTLLQTSNNSQDTSFIQIIYTTSSCTIQNVRINEGSQFQNFIFLINQIEDDNNLDDQTTTMIKSLKSTFDLENFMATDTTFIVSLLNIQENTVNVKTINIINCKNPSLTFANNLISLNIESLTSTDNILIDQPLLNIINSFFISNSISIYTTQIKGIDKDSLKGMIELTSTDFNMDTITALNNQLYYYFLVIKQSLSNTFINKISHADITASEFNVQKGGGIISSQLNNLLLQNIKIEYAQQLNGGAIHLNQIKNASFIKVSLKNNQALLSGGGIYLVESDLSLNECDITQNVAYIGGGLRYQNTQIIPQFLQQNLKQLYENKANIFGKNYGSYPFKIVLKEQSRNKSENSQEGQTQYNQGVSSVNQQPTQIAFFIYGEEEGDIVQLPQLLKSDNEIKDYYDFTLSIISSEQIMIQNGQNTYSSDPDYLFTFNKFFTLSGYSQLSKTSKMEESKDIKVILKSIFPSFYIPNFKTQMMECRPLQLEFNISFRPCQVGEIIRRVQQDYYECLKCGENTYSLEDPYSNIESNVCKDCVKEARFCKGSEIIPQEGYWRDPGTDYIEICQNAQSLCTQAQGSKEGCSEGSVGPLCESCDYESKVWGRNEKTGEIEKRYAKKGKFKCTLCNDSISKQNQLSLSIILMILFGLYLANSINSNLEQMVNKICALYLKKGRLILLSNSLNQNQKTSVTAKIIISYFQFISIISNLKINIPDSVSAGMFLGNVMETTFYSVDCFFVNMGFASQVPMVYLRLIWIIVQPVLYVLFLILFFSVLVLYRRRKKQVTKVKNLIISGLLKVFYMIYPSMIQQSIGSVACKNINGTSYVLIDLQYQCYDHNYFYFNFFITIPILLTILLIPYVILLKITKYKQNLTEHPQVYLSYGFFFSEYRPSRTYWEIVKIYQKIFIFIFIGLFNESTLISSIIVSVVILLYLKYQLMIKPFSYDQFNRLDHLSQLTSITTILCLSINSTTTNDTIAVLSLIIVILINLYFALSSLQCIFSQMLEKKQFEFLLNLIKKLHLKYPKVFIQPKFAHVNLLRLTKNWMKVKGFIKSKDLLSVTFDPMSQRETIQLHSTNNNNNNNNNNNKNNNNNNNYNNQQLHAKLQPMISDTPLTPFQYNFGQSPILNSQEYFASIASSDNLDPIKTSRVKQNNLKPSMISRQKINID